MRTRRVAVVALVAIGLVVGRSADPGGADAVRLRPVVSGLEFAVNLALLPGGRILVAEKATGRVRVVEDGRLLDEPLLTLPVDASNNETGLLGLAVDPAFPDEPWIYAYFSDARDGMNRLVRIRVGGDAASEPETLFEAIPTTAIHNGGDLAFASDGTLFLVTGDGAEASSSQDPDDPRGKILAFERDGRVPAGNPNPGSPVYALGIRNSFGVCVDPERRDLWATENGPESWDEVNRIDAGANHGWPEQLGPGGEPGYVDPVLGFERVIVPTGCAVSEGELVFGDYGGRLHVVSLPANPGDDVRDDIAATFEEGVTDVAVDRERGAMYVLTTTTLYRSSPSSGSTGGEAPTPTSAPRSADEPSASTSAGDASPGGPGDGIGGALGTTTGVVVIALLAGAFLWLRSRALRR